MTFIAITPKRSRFPRSESQIEVVDGKIVQATPAYRWAIGKEWKSFKEEREKDYRFERIGKRDVAKSLGIGTFKAQPPSEEELRARLTVKEDPEGL